MNPLGMSRAAGHSVQAILKHLSKADPEIGKKIQQSMAAGYTAEQIISFLSDVISGGSGASAGRQSGKSQDKDLAAMNVRAPSAMKRNQNAFMQDTFAPAVLGAGVVGAVAGGLAGGPAGALAGATGSGSAASELMNSYNQRVQQGDTIGFTDFLKAAAKGAMGAGSVMAATEMLQGLRGGKREVGGGLGDPQKPQQLDALGYISGLFDPQSLPTALKLMKGLGPQPMMLYLRSQFGSDIAKRIKQETGMNPLDVARLAQEQLAEAPMSEERGPEGPAMSMAEEAQLRAGKQEQEPEVAGEMVEAVEAPALSEEELLQLPHHEAVSRSPLGTMSIDIGSQIFKGGEGNWRPVSDRWLRNPKRLASSNAAAIDYDWENGELSILYALKPGDIAQKQLEPGERQKRVERIEARDYLSPKEMTKTKHSSVGTHQAYRMPMDNKTFIKMLSDEGIPVTQGASPFGMWDPNKKDSYGAKLNKFVTKVFRKATPDQKIEVKDLANTDMELIQDANKAWSAGRFLDGFSRLQQKFPAKDQIRKQDWNDLLDEYGSEELEEAVIDVILEFKNQPSKELGRRIETEAAWSATGQQGPSPWRPSPTRDLRKPAVDKRVRERLRERSQPQGQRSLEKKVRRIERR